MEIIEQFEVEVPQEPASAKALSEFASAGDISGDQVLIYTGGVADNSGRVYVGKSDVAATNGMPIPGGTYLPLAAELSVKGGYPLSKIFVVSPDAGQLLRVMVLKDKP